MLVWDEEDEGIRRFFERANAQPASRAPDDGDRAVAKCAGELLTEFVFDFHRHGNADFPGAAELARDLAAAVREAGAGFATALAEYSEAFASDG